MRPEDPASDLRWMEEALKEAGQAGQAGEVPVGAVIVRGDEVLARGRNRVESLRDPSAHAELLAIRSASSALRYQRLSGCTLYVTLEPCAMCAGAVVLARLARVVFGASDPKAGACGSLMNLVQDARLNHRVVLVPGVLSAPCGGILSGYFRGKR